MKRRTHPNYDTRIDLWNFFMLSFRGGNPYVVSDALFQYAFEEAKDYKKRKERAYYLNFCRPVVDTYTKYIHGSTLSRVATPKLEVPFETLKANSDGNGTDLHMLFRRIDSLCRIFGKMGVLCPGPAKSSLGSIRTRVDLMQAKQRIVPIVPQNVLDWSVAPSGEFNWVLLRFLEWNDADWSVERKKRWRYHMWTKDFDFVFYERDSDSSELILEETRSAEHGLGIVPFVFIQHAQPPDDAEPESLLEDIAIINRTLFNYCSCEDQIIYDQTFSQLTLGADGDEIDKQVMGTNRIWNYPKDAPYPPAYIAPDASQAKVVQDAKKDCVDQIYRLAMLPNRGKSTDVYNTALGKRIDFEDTNNALLGASGLIQEGELKVSNLCARWLGQGEDALLWKPNYPKSFDARSFSQELADALELKQFNMGDEFWRAAKKRLAKQALPDEDPSTMDAILKEIDTLIEEVDLMPSIDEPPSSSTGEDPNA